MGALHSSKASREHCKHCSRSKGQGWSDHDIKDLMVSSAKFEFLTICGYTDLARKEPGAICPPNQTTGLKTILALPCVAVG